MKTHTQWLIPQALFLLSVFLFAFTTNVEAASLATSPSSGSYNVGDTITVDIILDTQGDDASAVDIQNLNYDPTLLSVIDEDSGDSGVQIDAGILFPVTVFNLVNTTAGEITFSQTSGATDTPFNGVGTLATVRFTVLAEGNATLSFDHTTGQTNDTNVGDFEEANQGGGDLLTSALGASFTLGNVGQPSTKFTIGEEVEVTGTTLNVRASAGGVPLGAQVNGARGIVIGGPQFAGGFWYWEINYDTAPDGWSAEDFLEMYTPPTQNFDFTLSNNGNISATQGAGSSNSITATLSDGQTESIDFSVSGLPSGTTHSFSQGSCSPTCSTTLTLTSGGSTPVGTSAITVTATNGTLSRNTTFNFVVNAPADTQAPVPSGIGAGNITTNSATISWNTNEGATSAVDYGLSTSYGNTSSQSTLFLTSHSRILTGLSVNTTYNYRVRSEDAAGNEATSLNRTFTTQALPDTQKPERITNFSTGNIGLTSAVLTWTAPNDLPSGGVASYDIRYRTNLLTSINWASATQVTGEPSPGSPGTSESYTLVGLVEGTTYYVGIRSQDSASSPNIADLSNVVMVTTNSTPVVPSPTVSITANGSGGSAQVDYNDSVTLSWSSTNAVSCTATGDWSVTGTKSVNDSESTGALTQNATYTITCSNSEGETAQDSVVVNVGAPPEPTLSFLINGETSLPTLPVSNSGVTLSWNAINATSCTASGDWSGSRNVSGNEDTGALTEGKTYTLTCAGPGGSIQETRTVNVQLPDPTPTLEFLVNGEEGPVTVTEGETITLSWSATNSNFCNASNGWLGQRDITGTEDVVVTEDTVFTFACIHLVELNGYVIDSVTVNTVPAPIPVVSVSILANGSDVPISIANGNNFTLSWTSTNADSCTASNGTSGWSGSQDTAGSITIENITESSSFAISCTNEGGTQSDSISVNITSSTTSGGGGSSGGGGGGGGGGGSSSGDTIPPGPPRNLEIFGGPDQVLLTWDNPTDRDFVRTIVVRKEGSPPIDANDGNRIYEGIAEEFTDTDVVDGVTYYYALFSFDERVNYSVSSGGSTVLGQLTEQEISDERNEQEQTQCVPGVAQSELALTRSLFAGVRGDDVLRLQKFLNANGFVVSQTGGGSPGNETTFYGAKTRSAVQAFQCAQNVVCSGTPGTTGYGVVGPKTRAALVAFSGSGGEAVCITPPETPTIPTTPPVGSVTVTRWLWIGSRGDDVLRLQQFLNNNGFVISQTGAGAPGNETNFFGRKTEEAVRRFQCARLGVCSGTVNSAGYGGVGPRTRAALRGE